MLYIMLEATPYWPPKKDEKSMTKQNRQRLAVLFVHRFWQVATDAGA